MEYYKFVSKDGLTRFAAVTDGFLKEMRGLVFHDQKDMFPFKECEDVTFVTTETFDKNVSKIASQIEISHSEFTKSVGMKSVEDTCYASREEFYRGAFDVYDLESNNGWWETCINEFGSSRLADDLAETDDIVKAIDGQADSLNVFLAMYNHFINQEPEIYLEAWSRYLFGFALAQIELNKEDNGE